MPEPQEIRKRLCDFLGESQFRKFVKFVPAYQEGRRLLFWQERAWEKFVAEHPDCDLDFGQMVTVFRICSLHGNELEMKAISVVHGCVDYAPEFWQLRNERFPYAPMPFFQRKAGRCPRPQWISGIAPFVRNSNPNGSIENAVNSLRKKNMCNSVLFTRRGELRLEGRRAENSGRNLSMYVSGNEALDQCEVVGGHVADEVNGDGHIIQWILA